MTVSAVWNRRIYGFTIFLSAFLLFQVQLIIAKYVLPWYGGSASVWTTSLLFFQLLLLLGYGYSHLLANLCSIKRRTRVHFVLMGLSLLVVVAHCFLWNSPILAAESWKPSAGGAPVREIFLLLSVSIGIPFLLLSATSPLLQSWIAHLQPDRSPYPLYSFSNLGSLIGLLSYPFFVEPVLRLSTQAWIWGGLFLVFTAGCSFCVWILVREKTPGADSEETAGDHTWPGATTLLFWFGLTFCGSTMLLAVTNQLCQEIAVVPLLWVLPLSLYLLSFVICFHRERWYQRRFFLSLMGLATVLSLDLLSSPLERSLSDQIVVFSLLLFTICMNCHGEVVRIIPSTRYLTSFYLMVALGGVGGGVFVGAIAPYLFTGFWELHLGIFLSWALILFSLLRDKGSFLHQPSFRLSYLLIASALLALFYFMTYPIPRFVSQYAGDSYLLHGLIGILAFVYDSFHGLRSYFPVFPVVQPVVLWGLLVLGFLFFTSRTAGRMGTTILRSWGLRASWISLLSLLGLFLWNNVGEYYQDTVQVSRSFYGITKVLRKRTRTGDHTYSLFHGQTLHGLQIEEFRELPTTYFGVRSGIGILMVNYQGNPSGRNIGVLGLGAGTLAAYGTSTDKFCFYEINSDVIELAKGQAGYFSFLSDSQADIEIVEGDARMSLEEELATAGIEPFDILVLDVFSSDAIPIHLLTKEAFEVYLARLKSGGVLAMHITNRFLDLKPVVKGVVEFFGLHYALVHDMPRETTEQESTWVLLSSDRNHFDQPPLSLVRSAELDPIQPLLWTDDFSNLFELTRF